jgi:hypothetical protein
VLRGVYWSERYHSWHLGPSNLWFNDLLQLPRQRLFSTDASP